MTDQTLFHYQIERSRSAATIYIVGDACALRDIKRIGHVIDRLPSSTRVLRVDLHGVVSMTLESLMDLRGMLARWRSDRRANVHLVLCAPLPREEWPTSSIHFERAPLRLVARAHRAEVPTLLPPTGSHTHVQRSAARPQLSLHVGAASAGAR